MEKKRDNWKTVCKTFFRNEASLHGIRYVFLQSPLMYRRFIWLCILITALIFFIYLNSLNLIKYNSHPKKVSVDVSVKSSLIFPAVTICNYNKHRFTKVADLGLFDALYTKHEPELASQPVRMAWYRYREDLCIDDDEEFKKVLQCNSTLNDQPCIRLYEQNSGVSSIVCEDICSQKGYDMYCNGFWYNRTSSTCYISSVLMKKNVTSQSIKCEKESLEYYEKYYIMGPPSFLCTFDIDDCEHLDIDSIDPGNRGDISENFVIAKASKETNDYTGLLTHRGRYLGLFETKRRRGYKSKFSTNMHMFNNSCLEFFYRFLGEGVTSLNVTLLSKYKTAVQIGSVSGSSTHKRQWNRFFSKLPDGPGKLSMIAQRADELVTSGLIIDNFGIKSCDFYNVECLRDKQGLGYVGNISVTKSGFKCIAKSQVPYRLGKQFCRNPDHDLKPWCYVKEDISWELCDIPRCACPVHEFFCEKSGVCIPRSMTCDGQVDCEVGEDETKICKSKQSLQCDFSDDFLCGYMYYHASETIAWQRKNAREIVVPYKPETDFNKEKDGYFIFVDTQSEAEGTTSFFWSPPFKLPKEENVCVTFWMRSISHYSFKTNLRLYLSSTEDFYMTRFLVLELDLTNETNKEWKQHAITLPSSEEDLEFELTWMYTMGLPLHSNIAIDNIAIDNKNEICPKPSGSNKAIPKMRKSFTCDFTDPDTCEIEFFTNSWQWAPVLSNDSQYVFGGGRCPQRYAWKGFFRTPEFPEKTASDWACLGRIMGPEGSKIRFTFYNMKFALSDSPNCTNIASYILITGRTDVSYCGFESQGTDKTVLIDHHKARLAAWSVERNLAFQGSYELIGNHKEYVLVLETENSNRSPDNYAADIATHGLQLNEVHCFTMDFMTELVNITITLSGNKQYVKIYEGSPKTILRKTLPVGTYSVSFRTDLPGQKGLMAVIKELKIEPGWCQSLYDEGNINCDFDDRSICGYMDISSDEIKWEKGTGGMIVQSHKTGKTTKKANLISPTFSATKMSCLWLNVSSEHQTRLRVSVLATSDILDRSNAEFFEVIVSGIKDQRFTIPIRVSAKRVMFTAELKERTSVELHSVSLLSESRACTETTYVMKMQGQVDSGVEEAMEALSVLLRPKPETTPSLVDIPKIIPDDSPPESNEKIDSHKRSDFTAYFDVDELNENTAHQLEDMVFSCKFNDENCDLEKDFIKQKTIYGVCYTFNSGEKKSTIKQTTIPGSRHGLRLVLNIETYEHMKGLKIDDGIKIHIHDQDDIPYVEYVGKAAALSQHTYFEISRQDLYSMKAPYGECDSKDLPLFPNQTYTRYRCNRQCQSLAWQTHCGCIDDFMPGDGKYCTILEWEECQETINMSDIFSCECPTACLTTSYPSQTSASSLASFGVAKYLLEEEKIKRIEEHLEDAINKDLKMMPELYQSLTKHIFDVNWILMEVRQFINEQSVTEETSRFSLIQRALQEFYYHTEIDIRKLEPALQKLQDEAECITRLDELLKRGIEVLQHNIEYLKFLFSKSALSMSISTFTDSDRKNMLVLKTHEIVEYFSSLIDVGFMPCIMPDGEVNPWLPTRNDLLAKKVDIIKDLRNDKETRIKIFDILNAIIPSKDVILEQYFSNKTIEGALDQLGDYVTVNFTALHEYNAFYTSLVDDVMADITEAYNLKVINPINPDHTAESEIDKRISSLITYLEDTFYTGFVAGGMTATEVVRNLTHDRFESMTSVLKKAKSMVQNQILDRLNAEIHQHGPGSTYSTYMKALTSISSLYPYLSDTVKKNFTATVRSMNIWKKPSANIDNDDYVTYDWSELSLSRTWPKTLNFADFYEFSAEKTLWTNIARFYRQLGDQVSALETDMSNQIEAIEDAYMALNSSLRGIIKSLQVDEDFILKNFLKVDVFYGELVHNVMKASSAYELYDFFNGIGGYFGLLLGASCITLIEFLDLIVYNAYLQLRKLRISCKKKQSTANEKDKTSSV